MTVSRIDMPPRLRSAGRRAGYGVAVVVNLVLLVIVQFILDWQWLPFLTEEFRALVPWISLSLVAPIAANLVYQFDDSTPVRSTGQILCNLVSLVVTYEVFEVFPFDFSAYDYNWEAIVRFVLILTMVGSGVGVLTEAVKLTSNKRDDE